MLREYLKNNIYTACRVSILLGFSKTHYRLNVLVQSFVSTLLRSVKKNEYTCMLEINIKRRLKVRQNPRRWENEQKTELQFSFPGRGSRSYPINEHPPSDYSR